jgi:hypothetical protein
MKIHQPGGHLDQMMRQTRGNLLRLAYLTFIAGLVVSAAVVLAQRWSA